jgi:peptidoglycan hydrolase-like protein with peptidoglycan-binding domain
MASLPMLTIGSGGTFVKTVQGLLNARGYIIPIDGTFGPDTMAAVKKAQTAYHLTDDGVVGPETWPVLITGSHA